MRGLLARCAASWFGRRNLTILYRGQREAAARILSPLARRDPDAQDTLLARMRASGLDDNAIAGFTACWHEHPVPPLAAPPGLAGAPLGAVGITLTSMLGIAVDHAAGGVVYTLRVPADSPLRPLGWPGLPMEGEYILLEEPQPENIIKAMPAEGMPSLMVDERDRLAVRK